MYRHAFPLSHRFCPMSDGTGELRKRTFRWEKWGKAYIRFLLQPNRQDKKTRTTVLLVTDCNAMKEYFRLSLHETNGNGNRGELLRIQNADKKRMEKT